MGFELGEEDVEASQLYPDYKYTSIDQLLDIFQVNPPKPASAAFKWFPLVGGRLLIGWYFIIILGKQYLMCKNVRVIDIEKENYTYVP